jgi:hypothetical protein
MKYETAFFKPGIQVLFQIIFGKNIMVIFDNRLKNCKILYAAFLL